MDRTVFRDIIRMFDITDDIMMDRVFKAFDTDNDSFISMEEWIKGMSVFLRGTLPEKTKFCFYIYDMGGDGYIGRDDMFHLLKNCIVKSITDEDQEEPVRELVEYCLKLLDIDRDQRVSPGDFSKAVQNDNLLLELLGTCLPSSEEFIYRKQMSRVNRHKKLASDQSVYTKTVLRGHDVTLDRLLHSYDNQLSNRCSELDHEMYIVETYGEEILPRCQKVHDRCVQNTRVKVCRKYLKQKLLDDYSKLEKSKSENLQKADKNA
ncbi:hypothetical protein LSH36_369g03043 [Paralvinella palmiformis]|uniref:EF-hand domain-containing protein n=1 Tax=Paralvinella palmiformis TaxID=53620 RepID=A0AAD9MZ84_9ANNE|nr:hypothetical protein LSH36_369g03043 [Paralvinella palmiformis]